MESCSTGRPLSLAMRAGGGDRFSKNLGCMESNEAEVVAILKVLHIFTSSFSSKLAVESDSKNAFS